MAIQKKFTETILLNQQETSLETILKISKSNEKMNSLNKLKNRRNVVLDYTGQRSSMIKTKSNEFSSLSPVFFQHL